MPRTYAKKTAKTCNQIHLILKMDLVPQSNTKVKTLTGLTFSRDRLGLK